MQYALLSLALASIGAAFEIPAGSDFGALEADLAKRITYSTDPGPCSPNGVHIIAAGGGNYSDPYAYGLLGTLPTNITAKIPGSSSVSLPYDKQKDPLHPANLTANAIPDGIVTANNYIRSYHAKCPTTKIVTLGYSSGAVIMMSALCGGGVDMSLAGSTIIANIAYGDQTRYPGASFDKGTCINQGGKRPRNPATCGTFQAVTQSYCDYNDPQCCHGPAEDFMIHFVYPNKYNMDAADYVLMKFLAAGGVVGGASATSSVMSSTASSGFASIGSMTANMTFSMSSPTASIALVTSTVGAVATSTNLAANSGAGSAASTSTVTPFNANSGNKLVMPSLALGAIAILFAVLL